MQEFFSQSTSWYSFLFLQNLRFRRRWSYPTPELLPCLLEQEWRGLWISCWQSGLILLTKELWGLLIPYEAYEHSLYMASYGVGVASSLNISYLQKGGSLSSWPRSCEAPWTPTRPMNTPRKVKVIEVEKKTFSRDFSKDFKRCKI